MIRNISRSIRIAATALFVSVLLLLVNLEVTSFASDDTAPAYSDQTQQFYAIAESAGSAEDDQALPADELRTLHARQQTVSTTLQRAHPHTDLHYSKRSRAPPSC